MIVTGADAGVPGRLVADGVLCDPQWVINSHAIGFLAGPLVPDAVNDGVIEAAGRHGPVEVAALCEEPSCRVPAAGLDEKRSGPGPALNAAGGLSREIGKRWQFRSLKS
jgi:hypothetical protein